MQFKRRKDKNHGLLMAAFASHPAVDVLDLYQVGGGCPDLLVSIQSWGSAQNVLVEVKNGEKAPYTEPQLKFKARWRGPVETARNMDDVVAIIEKYRGKL